MKVKVSIESEEIRVTLEPESEEDIKKLEKISRFDGARVWTGYQGPNAVVALNPI